MKIAVIPARGGSKRIPRKNIKTFAGKPMISYAIEAALESNLFDRVLVSTDDAEIIEIAQQYGAETPFIRRSDLADDQTATVPVIAHSIEACESLGWQITAVCCIYPGVPFIKVEDLRQTWSLLESRKAPYAFPVTEFPSAIQRALKLSDDGVIQPSFPEYELVRTQDLEMAYHDAGQFYWGWRNSWLKYPRIHSHGLGFPIPNWRAIDIDTYDDWIRAELFHKAINTP
jgi:pseudaminic acid cytidylyltransferase